VMHRVVRALATTPADAAIAARIAAVVLIGDGDQVPHDDVTRFGTAGAGAHGIGLALRTISHSSAAKLPPGIGSRVLEVCNKHDIVCGWTDLDLVCLDIGIPTTICANGVSVHLHYPGSQALADAAAQAAADLRARLPTKDYVYVTDTSGTVIPINTTNNTVGTPISASTDPTALAVTQDGTTAYVANSTFTSGWVTPVNLATGTEGQAISLSEAGPTSIAISPDGKTAYVVTYDYLTPINIATNTAGTPIAVGGDTVAITPDGKTAYLTRQTDDDVAPVDLTSGTVGPLIPVGASPSGIAVTPNGATAYVTTSGDDTVTPINLSTNAAETPIPVGYNPDSIAVAPNGKTAYVVSINKTSPYSGDGTVTPITLSTGTVGKPIRVGVFPCGIAITPDGTAAYVANLDSGTVTPINLATNTAGTAIPAASPGDLAAVATTYDGNYC
jgi:YVTN family beta-propeller protein